MKISWFTFLPFYYSINEMFRDPSNVPNETSNLNTALYHSRVIYDDSLKKTPELTQPPTMYKPPSPPPSNSPTAYYSLPYIKLGVNCWKSYTVEVLTVALLALPVYGVLFPLSFLVQSLYMIPLHIYGFPMLVYRYSYSTLARLDSFLP